MINVQRWLKQIGSDRFDEVNDITIFNDQLYLTGITGGSFSPGLEKDDVGFDAWLGRFDLTTGNQEWVVQLGSDPLFNIPSDAGNAVATDSTGNVYLVGETEGTFGNAQGRTDGFIAEYDESGNLNQLLQIGTDEADVIEEITIVDDLIYVVGSTKGTFSDSNPDAARQIWVAEYSLNLERNWITEFTVNNNSFSEPTGVVIEGNNLFVAGNTRDEENNIDGWLGRLDRNNPDVAPIITSIASSESNRDTVNDLTIDSAGNIYVTGETSGTVSTDANANFGSQDGWLGKYTFDNATFTFNNEWITQIGTPQDDRAMAVITTADDESDSDSDDNIIVTGETEGVIDFDNQRNLGDPENSQAGLPILETNRGSVDVFFIQFDSAGNGGNPENDPTPSAFGNQSLPTIQIGSSSTDTVTAIAKDENQNLHPVGNTFGDLGSTSLGNSDVWLGKYAQLASPPLEQQFILIDETPSPDEALRKPLEDNPGLSRKSFVRSQDNNLGFDINYDVSDGNEDLIGLAIRIHFDSSKLDFNALEVDFPFVEIRSSLENTQTDITPEQEQQIDNGELTAEEAGGWDNNPNTDQFINLTLLDTDGNFPSQGGLPTFIGRANFTTDLDFFAGSTEINFTEIDAPEGYEVNPQNITVQGRKYTYDIDGNNEVNSLTDGVLILRFLFGKRGEELVEGDVLGTGAVRTSAEEIEDYLLRGGRAFDVDGDLEARALTDGIIINRFLLGFEDEQLVDGAIGNEATRQIEAAAPGSDSVISIEEYIRFFLPNTPAPQDEDLADGNDVIA